MTSWITWKSATNPHYEELVEKATSPLNLPWPASEDIALNLEICDLIRSKTVPAKPAMQALRARVGSKNGRVQMSAMGLVDTCIKNGGDHFLAEIASREFVDEMTGVIKAPSTQPPVRELATQMFQQWAIAFEAKPELGYLPEMYRALKNQGIAFPPPPASLPSHLLTTATPPTWVDSDACMRCRTAFTFTNRKHHCRACGRVFDQACSAHSMALPALGIVQDVRVCDGCWAKGGRPEPAAAKVDPNTPPVPAKRTPRSAHDLDADLQRAIALSLAEAQPGARGRTVGGYVPSEPGALAMGGRRLEGSDADAHGDDDDDEELRMAIQASLREMERVRPTAPGEADDEPEYKPLPTYDLTPREAETLLAFSQTIDHATGFGDADLRRFPHAHALHDQAQMLSGKLARNVEEKGTKQDMLREMHDRLMMAIKRYDALLSEQDAYARRQADEERARRQAAQQQQQQQHQYGYRPYPAQPQYAAYSAAPPPHDPYAAPYAPPAPHATYAQYAVAPQHSAPAVPAPAPGGMYPSLQHAVAAPAPYSPDPYAQQRQPSAPQRQASGHATSGYATSPERRLPQRQSSMGAYPNGYAEEGAASLPHPAAQPPQAYQQASSPPRVPEHHPQQHEYAAYQPPQPVSAPGRQEQAPSFPAFPDAPTQGLPEREPPVAREPPKEALLIEL